MDIYVCIHSRRYKLRYIKETSKVGLLHLLSGG